jgi:hypothetical protein
LEPWRIAVGFVGCALRTRFPFNRHIGTMDGTTRPFRGATLGGALAATNTAALTEGTMCLE